MQDYEDIIPAMDEPMDEVKSSTNSTLAEKIMAKLKKPMVLVRSDGGLAQNHCLFGVFD